jgi:hypothetical protein
MGAAMSRLKVLFVAVLGYAIYSSSTGSEPAADPAPVEKSQAQIEDEARQEMAYQRTVNVGRVVKSKLRDPGSVVWERVLANADGSVICLDYRARNGLGGMGRELFVLANGVPSKAATDWDRHCREGTVAMDHARYTLSR